MRRPKLLDYCSLVLVATAALPVLPVTAAASTKVAKNSDSDGTAIAVDDKIVRSRTLYLALIRDMRNSGKTYAALAHLDAFDKLYPNDADAVILRGDCLVDIGSYTDAQAVYRKMLASRTTAAPANAGMGRIDGLNGRWTEAVVDFGRAVDVEPTNPHYLNDLGYALMRQGDLTQALFRIKQASELAPGDVLVRNNLILVLSATGDKAGAKLLLDGITNDTERADIQAAIVAQASPRAPAAAAPAPAG